VALPLGAVVSLQARNNSNLLDVTNGYFPGNLNAGSAVRSVAAGAVAVHINKATPHHSAISFRARIVARGGQSSCFNSLVFTVALVPSSERLSPAAGAIAGRRHGNSPHLTLRGPPAAASTLLTSSSQQCILIP